MNNFSINPISKFRGQPPTFQQPKEVGFFSFDEQRGLHHDNRQLVFFLSFFLILFIDVLIIFFFLNKKC